MVARGTAESAITVVVPALGSSVYGPGGPAVARLDVTVQNPGMAGITDLVSTASVAAAEAEVEVYAQVNLTFAIAA